MPFISQQKYNEAIKEIFEVAGITRLNPTTGIEEQVPINTIATSHIVRRCNLHKKVKDQNLVGSLTGSSPSFRINLMPSARNATMLRMIIMN